MSKPCGSEANCFSITNRSQNKGGGDACQKKNQMDVQRIAFLLDATAGGLRPPMLSSSVRGRASPLHCAGLASNVAPMERGRPPTGAAPAEATPRERNFVERGRQPIVKRRPACLVEVAWHLVRRDEALRSIGSGRIRPDLLFDSSVRRPSDVCGSALRQGARRRRTWFKGTALSEQQPPLNPREVTHAVVKSMGEMHAAFWHNPAALARTGVS